MSFIASIKSLFSPRGKALALYRSGMAKAKNHDYHGAIADYWLGKVVETLRDWQ